MVAVDPASIAGAGAAGLAVVWPGPVAVVAIVRALRRPLARAALPMLTSLRIVAAAAVPMPSIRSDGAGLVQDHRADRPVSARAPRTRRRRPPQADEACPGGAQSDSLAAGQAGTPVRAVVGGSVARSHDRVLHFREVGTGLTPIMAVWGGNSTFGMTGAQPFTAPGRWAR